MSIFMPINLKTNETSHFILNYNLPKLTQEEMGKLSRLMVINEIEAGIKSTTQQANAQLITYLLDSWLHR